MRVYLVWAGSKPGSAGKEKSEGSRRVSVVDVSFYITWSKEWESLPVGENLLPRLTCLPL